MGFEISCKTCQFGLLGFCIGSTEFYGMDIDNFKDVCIDYVMSYPYFCEVLADRICEMRERGCFDERRD